MVPDLSTIRPVRLDRRRGDGDVRRRGQRHPSTGRRSPPDPMLRAQLDTAAATGLVAKGASELEFFLYRDSYRDAGVQGLRRPRAGRLVRRGLPPVPGRPRRGLRRRRPAGAERLRDPGRELEGRGGDRTTRAEHPLRRTDGDGRSSRGDEAGHERARRRTGCERVVHGQAARRSVGQQLSSPRQFVERRRQRVQRRRRWLDRRVPLVPGRVDEARRSVHAVLRPDDQQLQALPGPVVGADRVGVVTRQPHDGVPNRR